MGVRKYVLLARMNRGPGEEPVRSLQTVTRHHSICASCECHGEEPYLHYLHGWSPCGLNDERLGIGWDVCSLLCCVIPGNFDGCLSILYILMTSRWQG